MNKKLFSVCIIFMLSCMATFGMVFLFSNETVAENYPYTSKYSINLRTWNYTNTWIDVTTGIRSQEWISNQTQECSVTITLNQSDHVKKITIHEVWIAVHSEYDESDGKYSEMQIVSVIQTNDELLLEGEKKEYTFEIKIAGEHDRLAIVGYVDLNMEDVDGGQDIIQVKPFVSNSHPENILEISVTKRSDNFVLSSFLVYVAAGAIIGGVIGLTMFILTKKKKDTSNQVQSQSNQNTQAQEHQVYPCITCGQHLTYVNQYSKWYCSNCEKYMS